MRSLLTSRTQVAYHSKYTGTWATPLGSHMRPARICRPWMIILDLLASKILTICLVKASHANEYHSWQQVALRG